MKTDWNAIREEYIRGGSTQRELAKKYGVNPRSLSRRAVKEEWFAQKREYHLARHAARMACPEDEFFLEGVREAADTLTDTVKSALQNPEQIYGGKDGKVPDKIRADVSEVQKWAAIVRELSVIMRSLYDVPGLMDRQQMNLQERKLDLEEKKIAPGEGQTEDARVFLPKDQFTGEDA